MINNQSINEVRVIGREISQKTFSGKNLDYKIPHFDEVKTSLDDVKKALMDSMQDYDDIALLFAELPGDRLELSRDFFIQGDVVPHLHHGRLPRGCTYYTHIRCI